MNDKIYYIIYPSDVLAIITEWFNGDNMLDFNKDEKIDLKVLGTKVLLKKCVKTLNKKYGNIILPHDVDKNSSLGVAIIEDLGSEAKN